MELALLFACRECGRGYHTEIDRDRHEAKHTHVCNALGNPDGNMFQVIRELGADINEAETSEDKDKVRIKCTCCERRRMCRMYAWIGSVPGCAMYFCRECEDG